MYICHLARPQHAKQPQLQRRLSSPPDPESWAAQEVVQMLLFHNISTHVHMTPESWAAQEVVHIHMLFYHKISTHVHMTPESWAAQEQPFARVPSNPLPGAARRGQSAERSWQAVRVLRPLMHV